MVTAMAYPDKEKGGRGNKINSSKNEEFRKISSGNISMARYVLRNNFTLALCTTLPRYPRAYRDERNKPTEP